MENLRSNIHFEISPHFMRGIESNILYLMQDITNCLQSNNGLYDKFLMWNHQFNGNNVIYLINGIIKDRTGYYFIIRIGNTNLNVYTQKKLWFSYIDQNGHLIKKIHTVITSVTPVYNLYPQYNSYIETNNKEHRYHKIENNKRKRIENNSITQNDIKEIHQFLHTIRNQSKIKNNNTENFIPVPVLSIDNVKENVNLNKELTVKR